MKKNDLLVRVLTNIRKDFFCVVSDFDGIILKSPAYRHLETAVCFVLWQIKSIPSLGGRDVVLRVESLKKIKGV